MLAKLTWANVCVSAVGLSDSDTKPMIIAANTNLTLRRGELGLDMKGRHAIDVSSTLERESIQLDFGVSWHPSAPTRDQNITPTHTKGACSDHGNPDRHVPTHNVGPPTAYGGYLAEMRT